MLGFEQFDPAVHIAGVIFNKVGSPAHYEMLQAGVQEKCRAEVLGYIPRDDKWHTPERHLGLVMAAEREALQENVKYLARHLEQTVAVQKIIKLASAGCRVQDSEVRGQAGIRKPEFRSRNISPPKIHNCSSPEP